MDKPAPTNPYRHADLAQLAEACSRRAADLESTSTKSAEERRALAADTRYLLLAIDLTIGHGLLPDKYRSTPAERHASGEPLDVAYFDYAHSRLKRFRVAVLGLAADRQLGAEAKNWLADARIDGVPVREVAERSDAGLEQALVVLAKTEPRRPRPRR